MQREPPIGVPLQDSRSRHVQPVQPLYLICHTAGRCCRVIDMHQGWLPPHSQVVPLALLQSDRTAPGGIMSATAGRSVAQVPQSATAEDLERLPRSAGRQELQARPVVGE